MRKNEFLAIDGSDRRFDAAKYTQQLNGCSNKNAASSASC